MVLPGQLDAIGAGVGDVGVERRTLDVGVGRAGKDRPDHVARQLVGEGDAVVDVDAVGIQGHRSVVQRAPDQAQGQVGGLLGLQRAATEQGRLRAVGAQGALLHFDPVATA
ncbi:hypothetical protein D3C75_911780 [compost metagenome]